MFKIQSNSGWFMLPTIRILQNILELGPRLFISSEARGLSQVMQITGATLYQHHFS